MNKTERIEKLKDFVWENVKPNMTTLEAKRVRGFILATLGEL